MLNRLLASKKNPYIPGRNNKETFNIDLSGAKFSISLPPNSVWDIPEELPKSNQINIYDENLYSPLENLADYRKGTFPVLPLLTRTFGFWGSAFSLGSIGMIKCFVNVQRVIDAPKGFSCLNPADFEQALSKRLYYYDGPGSGHDHKILAPVDWKLLSANGVQWVLFEEHNDFSKWRFKPSPISKTVYSYVCQTPIAQDYILGIHFSSSGYLPFDICKPNIDKFVNEIIETLTLDLTEENIRQQNLFKSKGFAYSEKKEPEKWDYHTFKKQDGDTDTHPVIEKYGTPPPQLVATCK